MKWRRVKKAFDITLGIVTSIGGFIDAGALTTSLQAGARFGFRLMWATLLGTICAIFLTEMSGRLAIVSHHPLRELIHKRFGLSFSAPLLGAGLVVVFDQAHAVFLDFAPDVDAIGNQNGQAATERFDDGDAEVFLVRWKDKCVGDMERAPFEIAGKHAGPGNAVLDAKIGSKPFEIAGEAG